MMRKRKGAPSVWLAVLCGLCLAAGAVYWAMFAGDKATAREPAAQKLAAPSSRPVHPPKVSPLIASRLGEDRIKKYTSPAPKWSEDAYWVKSSIAPLEAALPRSATRPATNPAAAPENWIKAGKYAVVSWIKSRTNDPACTGDELEEAADAAVCAISQGCDDPLVWYIYALERPFLPGARWVDWETNRLANAIRAAEAFQTDDRYPPLRRCMGYLNGAKAALRQKGPPHEKFADFVQSAVALYPASLAEPGLPVIEGFSLLGATLDIVKFSQQRDESAKQAARDAMRDFLKALDAAPVSESFRLTVKGELYIRAAWSARGDRIAATVTEEGWRTFGENLAKARESLSKAWELDQRNADAATLMITVCMGEPKNRKEVDLWFNRVQALRPGDHDAIGSMLLYLEPKWHGGPQEMIAFAQALHARSEKEPAFAPARTAVVDAFWNLAFYAAQQDKLLPAPTLFEENPRIFDEIKRVYEAYLKDNPDARYHRTRYALIAGWSKQYELAIEQWNLLGGGYSRRLVSAETRSDNWTPELREVAARLAKRPAATAPSTPAP